MISVPVAALVLAAIAGRFAQRLSCRRQRAAVMLLVFVLAVLPFPWGAASWLISVTGPFSVGSLLLALAAIAHRLRGSPLLAAAALRPACWALVLVALLFYPLSLGVSSLDPYAWGYGDFRFSTALLLLGMLAWVWRAWLVCAVLVAAQFAFAARLLEADNLWNYLFDPMLVCWAFGWVLRDAWRRWRRAGTPDQALS